MKSQPPVLPEQVEAGGSPPHSPQGLRPHTQGLAQAGWHPPPMSGRPNGQTCPLPGQVDGLLQVQEDVLGVLPPLTPHPHCCGRQGSGSSAFIVPGAEAVRDGTTWQWGEMGATGATLVPGGGSHAGGLCGDMVSPATVYPVVRQARSHICRGPVKTPLTTVFRSWPWARASHRPSQMDRVGGASGCYEESSCADGAEVSEG